MAQGPTTPKIEELRFRLKTDPKNRLFYPLAEELRKVSQFTEAEQVLRTGLTHHPTYLSAWVSLGRVLRELGKNGDAVESLSKALQLDPGNVVAARLLADAYLSLGEKVEAIKKYKLVHALMPQDDTIVETIANLDAELNPPIPVAAPEPEPEPVPAPPEPEPEPEPELESGLEPELEPEPDVWAPAPSPAPFVMAEEAETPGETGVYPAFEPEAEREPEPEPAPLPIGAPALDESPFASDDAEILAAAEQTFISEREEAVATADDEPMLASHVESPFEEPVAEASYDAVAVEAPLGIHVEEAPLAAEVPAPLGEEEPAADVFTPTIETPFPDYEEAPVAAAQAEDVTDTVTMADLYARQGMNGKAREIYEHILQRDPRNDAVRARAEALDASTPAAATAAVSATSGDPKVARLQEWLAKMTGKEASRV